MILKLQSCTPVSGIYLRSTTTIESFHYYNLATTHQKGVITNLFLIIAYSYLFLHYNIQNVYFNQTNETNLSEDGDKFS